MKYITALLVALVALVGMSAAVVDNNNLAANGALQSASNGISIGIYDNGGYGGYPYYYDYYYYYPYGGYGGSGFTDVDVFAIQNIVQTNEQGAAVIGGQPGADGQDGADGQSADNVPAADTSVEDEKVAPVVVPVYSGPVSANGMQIVDGGESLAEEQMEIQTPLEYATYLDYNVLVVETRGVAPDVAQKFAMSAIANHGFKAVYFVQGLLVRADGSLENKTLDLSTPPRVARSLGYL
jgi:hypothetical protein